MMEASRSLIFIAEVQSHKIEALEQQLALLAKNVGRKKNSIEKNQSTHFLRWFVLPEDIDNEQAHFTAKLVFVAYYDGDKRSYVKALIETSYSVLIDLYSCCEMKGSYEINSESEAGANPHQEHNSVHQPAHKGKADTLFSDRTDTPNNRLRLLDYLLSLEVSDACFYTAHPKRTVSTIQQHAALRNKLDQLIDGNKAASTLSFNDAVFAPNIKPRFYHLLDKLTPQLGDLGFGRNKPYQALRELGALLWRQQLIFILMLALISGSFLFGGYFWLALTALILLFLVKLRAKEKAESAIRYRRNNSEVDLAHHQWLLSDEGNVTQTPMTSVTVIKPGRFRLMLLKGVLAIINYLAKTLFSQGALGSITSIHFAHWLIIDNGRRLLFISNFDGSWESYLGDFIDRAAVGLTAIWSNSVGFPYTSLLIYGGARNAQAFKNYTRASQIKTNYWFSAYPNLACPSILHNADIAQSLARLISQHDNAEKAQYDEQGKKFSLMQQTLKVLKKMHRKINKKKYEQEIEKWMAKL